MEIDDMFDDEEDIAQFNKQPFREYSSPEQFITNSISLAEACVEYAQTYGDGFNYSDLFSAFSSGAKWAENKQDAELFTEEQVVRIVDRMVIGAMVRCVQICEAVGKKSIDNFSYPVFVNAIHAEIEKLKGSKQ